MGIDPTQQAGRNHQSMVDRSARGFRQAQDAAGHQRRRGSNLLGLLILAGGGFYLYKHPELIGVAEAHLRAWLAATNT
jgi:hypothetical protein